VIRSTYIAALFLFLIGCKEKTESVPNYVLDKEKFSDIIVDFTLAESAAGINILNAQGLKGDTVYAFNPLIDNNVTRAKFDTSLYFYSHHPKLFKEVYELTLEKLSRMQASRK
jgi:hypothetical protein